jgi:hypothetical protein
VAVYSSTDVEKGMSESGGRGVISLVPPSFISTARAAGGGGGAFPEDEAGISAYVTTSKTIDLVKLKEIFLEVEEVGDNYIIGITNISDFGGDINVTVYADTSGWIVAYFNVLAERNKPKFVTRKREKVLNMKKQKFFLCDESNLIFDSNLKRW